MNRSILKNRKAGYLIVALAIAGFLAATWHRPSPPVPMTREIAHRRPELTRIGGPEEPIREITSDHKPARISHKDGQGRLPLEYVETRAGRVTIQRTFSLKGELLKEEAFLNGKSVPLPGSLVSGEQSK